MKFKFEETAIEGHYSMSIESNQHLDIAVLFDGVDAFMVSLRNDDIELDEGDDFLMQLFVGIGDKMVSLSDIVTEANKQIDDLVKEHLQDKEDWDDMAYELSSPRLTGRI